MKNLWMMLVMAIASLTFVACDNDPDIYYPWDYGQSDRDNPYRQPLSGAEQNIVGSYVSADGKTPIYLTLYNDRTGYYTTGNTMFKFQWVLLNGKLYLKGTNTSKNEVYTFKTSGNQLYLNDIPFVAKGSGSLTDAEKKLVGSFVSDDGKTPIYITLKDDRSGSYTVQGQTVTFQWYVTDNVLYMVYSDNTTDTYTIQYQNGKLYLNNIPFITYKGGESQSPLVGQWEGALDAGYYTDVYPKLPATGKYATIYEFSADGTGAQLDYDVSDPKNNYSCVTFSWVVNGQTISVSYNANEVSLTSASFDNYILTSTQFKGQMAVSGFASYPFNYGKTSGFDWSPYLNVTQTRTGRDLGRLMFQLRDSKRKAVRMGSFK